MIKFKVVLYKKVKLPSSFLNEALGSDKYALKPIRSFFADDIDGVYDLLDVFALEQHSLRGFRGLGHTTVNVFFRLKWTPELNSNEWIPLKDGAYYNEELNNRILYGY